MAVKCTNCGGSHPKWDCTKPAQKSTAARRDVRANKVISRPEGECPNTEASPKGCDMASHASSSLKTLKEGTQALPVDTNPRSAENGFLRLSPKSATSNTLAGAVWDADRQPKFDRNEYQRLYMRDKATIKRLGLNCTVKEYRESLK